MIDVQVKTADPTIETVTVTMPERDAQILRSMLGAMSDTLFELFDRLDDALREAGAPYLEGEFTDKFSNPHFELDLE
jgi:hypothetical protein